MCFVCIWEQRATCATYSINWLVFITEKTSVYCAVRAVSLTMTDRVTWRVKLQTEWFTLWLTHFRASFSSFLKLGISVKMKHVVKLKKISVFGCNRNQILALKIKTSLCSGLPSFSGQILCHTFTSWPNRHGVINSSTLMNARGTIWWSFCVFVWDGGRAGGQTLLIKPSAPIFTITPSYFCPRTDEHNVVMSHPPKCVRFYLPANVLFAAVLDGDNLVLRTVWVLLMR